MADTYKDILNELLDAADAHDRNVCDDDDPDVDPYHVLMQIIAKAERRFGMLNAIEVGQQITAERSIEQRFAVEVSR